MSAPGDVGFSSDGDPVGTFSPTEAPAATPAVHAAAAAAAATAAATATATTPTTATAAGAVPRLVAEKRSAQPATSRRASMAPVEVKTITRAFSVYVSGTPWSLALLHATLPSARCCFVFRVGVVVAVVVYYHVAIVVVVVDDAAAA